MENRRYLVGFGDSDRYRITFAGDRDAFLHSEILRELEERVDEFLRKEFPTGGYEAVTSLYVADDDGRPVRDLDDNNIADLLHSVKRQVEVMREGLELNNNAPYDEE